MRWALPVVLAVALALPVYAVAESVDERYEATASFRIEPLIPLTEVDRLLAAAGLERLDEDPRTPFVPGGAPVLERVAERIAGLPAVRGKPDVDDVEVIDTASELVFPKFKEPVRRLKVKAIDDDPRRAAAIATAFLDAYLRERKDVLISALERARTRLLAAKSAELRRASPALRREAAEAAEIAIELAAEISVGSRSPARAPEEPILPHPVRDALVAALVGAIAGFVLLRLPSLPRVRRARAAARS